MPLTYRYVRLLSTFFLGNYVVIVFVLICDNWRNNTLPLVWAWRPRFVVAEAEYVEESADRMRFGNMRCARASMNPLGWHFNWFRCFCIRFLASSFLYSYWESKEGFKSAQRLWNTVEEQQVSTEIVFALSNVFDLRYLFCFLFVTHGRGLREQYYDLSLFFVLPLF